MGNPLNGSKSVMEVQLVVGLSVEDEDWVVPFGERSTSSNESQGTSDEGLGLAMNPDIQPDQDESLGEIVYPDDVWYSDDVVNGHKIKGEANEFNEVQEAGNDIRPPAEDYRDRVMFCGGERDGRILLPITY